MNRNKLLFYGLLAALAAGGAWYVIYPMLKKKQTTTTTTGSGTTTTEPTTTDTAPSTITTYPPYYFTVTPNTITTAQYNNASYDTVLCTVEGYNWSPLYTDGTVPTVPLTLYQGADNPIAYNITNGLKQTSFKIPVTKGMLLIYMQGQNTVSTNTINSFSILDDYGNSVGDSGQNSLIIEG